MCGVCRDDDDDDDADDDYVDYDDDDDDDDDDDYSKIMPIQKYKLVTNYWYHDIKGYQTQKNMKRYHFYSNIEALILCGLIAQSCPSVQSESQPLPLRTPHIDVYCLAVLSSSSS